MYNNYIHLSNLHQLKSYRYITNQYTWLDKKFNPFWEWTLTLIPLWVSPNILTCIGLSFVFASYAPMLYLDLTLKKDLPNNLFIFAAFCLFSYSIFDAIDGKQARRTKGGSPLGQLLDHGGDSFGLIFWSLSLCQAFNVSSAQAFLLCLASQIFFQTLNWIQYNRSIFYTNVAKFGPTQGLILSITIHLMRAIFGQKFWQQSLNDLLPNILVTDIDLIGNIQLGQIFCWLLILQFFSLSIYMIITTLIQQKNIIILNQLIMTAAFSVLETIWLKFTVDQKYSGLIVILFNLMYSLITWKIIVCKMTKMKIKVFQWEILPLLIGTMLMGIMQINQYFKLQQTVFWGIFFVNCFLFGAYAFSVINQITGYLGISCFILQKHETKFQ